MPTRFDLRTSETDTMILLHQSLHLIDKRKHLSLHIRYSAATVTSKR